MEKLVKQRVFLKFCFSDKILGAKSLKMLQKTYCQSCMSKIQSFEWYKTFRESWVVIVDLPCSDGCLPSTNDSNIDKIKKPVIENHCMYLIDLAPEVNIFLKPFHNAMVNILGMIAVYVPKELNCVLSLFKSVGPKDAMNVIDIYCTVLFATPNSPRWYDPMGLFLVPEAEIATSKNAYFF